MTLAPVATAAGTIERISLSTAEIEGDRSSNGPRVSADGRYVVFESRASNLVDADTNTVRDIFLRDRLLGNTIRVSVSSDGTQANAISKYADISADGRVVAFASYATNLGSGSESNKDYDVFVHDVESGQTACVSLDSTMNSGYGNSWGPVLSANGRFVAFVSDARLVPEDNNWKSDIYVHDRRTGKSQRVSLASDGTESNGYSYDPAISADGRYIAFVSSADNLVAGDSNDDGDVFVHDLATRQTTRVSVSSFGRQGGVWTNGIWAARPSISADGRYVAFESGFSELVSPDGNGVHDIFVHDRLTGKTTYVSVASNGDQGDGDSFDPNISADGRYVVFGSRATNLPSGDSNGRSGIFGHDRATGQTQRIVNGFSQYNEVGDISADGRLVVFDSKSANRVAGDQNGAWDIFLRDAFLNKKRSSDLQVSQGVSHEPGNVGGTYSYAITVTNLGPDAAYDVTLQDIVSDHVNITAAEPSQGTCAAAALTLCRLGILEAGTSTTVTVSVTAQYDGVARNQVSVSSTSVDGNPADNSSVVLTTLLP